MATFSIASSKRGSYHHGGASKDYAVAFFVALVIFHVSILRSGKQSLNAMVVAALDEVYYSQRYHHVQDHEAWGLKLSLGVVVFTSRCTIAISRRRNGNDK